MNDFKNQLDALLCNSMKNDPEVRRLAKSITNQHVFKKRGQHVFWELLHLFSVQYPENPSEFQKENTKQLLLNIKFLVPFCTTCSNKYQDTFVENSDLDLAVSSTNELIRFLIEYHVHINTNLAKNENYDYTIYTSDYVKKKYQNELYSNFLEDTYKISFLKIISENVSCLRERVKFTGDIIIHEIKILNYELFVNMEIFN
jgi:hypothetical protein